MHSQVQQIVILGIFAIASLYFNVALITSARQASRRAAAPLRSPSVSSYSFIGSDWPKVLPVERDYVKLTVEESVHYSLTDAQAEAEWLWTAPIGDNHIRLGPDMRTFAVPMFHQLHCLRGIRIAMESGFDSIHPAQQEHIHHCFNYLRQYTLCAADVTLEPGDFTQRNFTTERIGATHVCKDWVPVYEMVKVRWYEWARFRDEHGIDPYHGDQKL